jgi:hypothetical protein
VTDPTEEDFREIATLFDWFAKDRRRDPENLLEVAQYLDEERGRGMFADSYAVDRMFMLAAKAGAPAMFQAIMKIRSERALADTYLSAVLAEDLAYLGHLAETGQLSEADNDALQRVISLLNQGGKVNGQLIALQLEIILKNLG